MSEWAPRESDLKRYPHFDRHLPIPAILNLVTDPEKVSKNSFFPFLRYTKKWHPFRHKGVTPKKVKERPIRYASRRDSYIFAYYRYLLSQPYESLLLEMGIENAPIAYRRILSNDGTSRGKCNIHFARDAFDMISNIGNCCVIALDISSYFESIDHQKLLDLWKRLLKVKRLPDDHFSVYRAITRYAFADRDEVYERVGFKPLHKPNSKSHEMQICSVEDFREKVCGSKHNYQSLVEKNKESYGIPQGAPLSDLLANIYLIEFDAEIDRYARERGGIYTRYSDDILVVLPGAADKGIEAKHFITNSIKKYGDQLKIKDEKTNIVEFRKNGEGLSFIPIQGKSSHSGLEYLGFRFDGMRIYLRNSTVSNFNRKIVFAARNEATKHVARYTGKDLPFLVKTFDLEDFISRFGRVEGFDESSDCRDWTFWTYVSRAAEIFGARGHRILRQVAGHRDTIANCVVKELARALRRKAKVDSLAMNAVIGEAAPSDSLGARS